MTSIPPLLIPQHVVTTFNRELLSGYTPLGQTNSSSSSSRSSSPYYLSWIDSIRLVEFDSERDTDAHITIRFHIGQFKQQLNLFIQYDQTNLNWFLTSIECTCEVRTLGRMEEKFLTPTASSPQSRPTLFLIVETCLKFLATGLEEGIQTNCIATRPWLHQSHHDSSESSHLWLLERLKCVNTTKSAPILPHILAQDLYLSMIMAAIESGRSTMVLKPHPECCRGETTLPITSQLESSIAPLKPLLPLYSHACQSPTPKIALAHFTGLPTSSSALLAYSLHRVLQFQLHGRLKIERNWYLFDNDLGLNLSCPTPDFQFDLDLPDPYFTARASTGSTSNTITVFHGSPFSNWYSILHNGLTSKSGTKEQTSGAIFGSGIYFTDDLRVARNFSKASHGWKESALGPRLECVGVYDLLLTHAGSAEGAVVRMANKINPANGSAAESAVPENYYVVTDNSYIRLRHLLIWRADGQRPQPIVFPIPTTIGIASSSTTTVRKVPFVGDRHQPFASLSRFCCSSFGVICGYMIVLLGLCLWNVDFHRLENLLVRMWRTHKWTRF